MRTVIALTLGLVLLVGIGVVSAQGPNPQPPAAPGGGSDTARSMPMMDMCREMHGSMMGMTGDQKMDPKMMAHMLTMRGEMMKAMGEVMMKHGRMMQGGPAN